MEKGGKMMTDENPYNGISHVVRVHTNYKTQCEHCDALFDYNEFAESINHYIEHGYKLLHIGTETHHIEGNLWYFSVATLGKKIS